MKKELVKPSSIKDLVEKEVESLCDGFSCDSLTASPPPVDTGDVSEILF